MKVVKIEPSPLLCASHYSAHFWCKSLLEYKDFDYWYPISMVVLNIASKDANNALRGLQAL